MRSVGGRYQLPKGVKVKRTRQRGWSILLLRWLDWKRNSNVKLPVNNRLHVSTLFAVVVRYTIHGVYSSCCMFVWFPILY